LVDANGSERVAWPRARKFVLNVRERLAEQRLVARGKVAIFATLNCARDQREKRWGSTKKYQRAEVALNYPWIVDVP